jgi:CheY-like chemotaxis protein
VLSTRKSRLQQWANEGCADARAALALAKQPGQFLSTTTVGITVIAILSGAFGEATFAGLLERSDGPGHGSEFIVRLPLTASTPAAVPATDADAPPVAAAGRRVMVADDNRDAADALAMLLELAGHEVRVAHRGRVAMALAQTFRPDVAIIDIGMPDLSGDEVAKELGRESWETEICLIALTGWGQDSDRQQAKDAGSDRHLTKPVEPQVLEALLSDDHGR